MLWVLTLPLCISNTSACVLGGVSGSGCVGCVSVGAVWLVVLSGGSAVSGCVAVGLCAVIIYLQMIRMVNPLGVKLIHAVY